MSARIHAGGAEISFCGRYRYRLWRRWDRGKLCVWLMLNPSTADGANDDATIRRCIGFAKLWGFAGIMVVNLYPIRETDARVAMAHPDRFGPDTTNYHAVRSAVRLHGNVTCAWGNGAPSGPGLDSHIGELERLVGWQNVFCLGVTKSGQPRHPVRLRCCGADHETVLRSIRKQRQLLRRANETARRRGDAIRSLLAEHPDEPANHEPANHRLTPCCGKPMVITPDEHPMVSFNPDNNVVQCHGCGETWAPLGEQSS